MWQVMWYNLNEKKNITLLKIKSERLSLGLFHHYVTNFLLAAGSF